MASSSPARVPRALAELNTFCVGLWPQSAKRPKEDKSIPAHETIIRPLVNAARECRIYGLDYDRKFLKWISPIVEKQGGSWRLKTDREVIRGWERFWNQYCKTNGIAIVADLVDEQMEAIFRYTSKPHLWSSLNMLTDGSSRAAVTFCQKAARDPNVVAVLFPGSNGIEWMDVFVHPDRLQSLYLLARKRGTFSAVS